MTRILIVNVNWIGDVLFSTPAIRAVRERYPEAHIACMVVPRCKEVLELNPRLDELIIYDEKNEYKGLGGKLRFIGLLRSQRFSTVFIFHRSLTRTLMVALSGIKERVGTDNPKRGFLLTKKVNLREADTHKVEQFIDIVKAKGIVASSRNMELFISEEDEAFARQCFRSHNIADDRLKIVLNPGGNWDLKRWPFENFAMLGDKLAEQFNAHIIITGADKDIELGNRISGMMRNKPVVTCGKTSLRQMAALLKRADLVISNDSGPMHVAVSQGARTIALFGPTNPKVTGPYGEGKYVVIQKPLEMPSCRIPCYRLNCQDNSCMKAITVEDVLIEAGRMLRQ